MITLREAELFRVDLRTRMPFRYGIATMTEVPHVILRLTFEIGGTAQMGISADHLPPKWFTKDPARALQEEIDEMLVVLRAAVTNARAVRAATPFTFWRELYAAQMAWANQQGLPPLLANFGTSLVERALIDAFCGARGATLASALRENLFAIDLGVLRPELAGTQPRDWLPASPATEVFSRHTIGLSDPLDAGEIAPADAVHDGLPQALAECIRFYGLRHFKIKINGELARDRSRLAKMAEIFAAECGGDYAFTLDGNESFMTAAAFPQYAKTLLTAPELKGLWPRLMFIEQPWHRSVALSAEVGEALRAWSGRPPIIIDESDAELRSVPDALALGYAGTSHKNCKGVFKSVANACLLAWRRSRGQPGLLSGEDLSNIGPVALLQDLAAAAALGVTSIERNGHHYFAGLAQFPKPWQAHAMKHHDDLFIPHAAGGWPRLNVQGGKIALGSINAAPFGVARGLDLTAVPGERLG